MGDVLKNSKTKKAFEFTKLNIAVTLIWRLSNLTFQPNKVEPLKNQKIEKPIVEYFFIKLLFYYQLLMWSRSLNSYSTSLNRLLYLRHQNESFKNESCNSVSQI